MSNYGTDFGHEQMAGRQAWTMRRIVMRAGGVVLLLILGAALGIVLQHVISGVKNQTIATAFQDWRLTCSPASGPDAACLLTQDVSQEQGPTLLRLALGDSRPGATLTITVPHGVLLDPGLGFSVAGSAVKVRPYETCDPVGCVADVILDDETLKALQTGEGGQVAIVPGDGKPVALPFSLHGFADGLAALKWAKFGRGFWSFLDR